MSVEFFIAKMNYALDVLASKCLTMADAQSNLNSSDAYRAMAASFRSIPIVGYKGFEWGMVPSYACADALLAMKMTDWETFYRGMAEWKAGAPNYPDKALAEEDARGVMLMALADRCRGLKGR